MAQLTLTSAVSWEWATVNVNKTKPGTKIPAAQFSGLTAALTTKPISHPAGFPEFLECDLF